MEIYRRRNPATRRGIIRPQMIDTQVLIVGAGPVGLTLAIDLAWRGIDVTVAETRYAGEPPSVKCNQLSARSMEIFRRLGIATQVRALGLPADYANDVVSCTSATGTELSRIRIPARGERFTDVQGADTWWPTPEAPHRINQTFLEPFLFSHAASQPRIRMLNRTQVESISTHDRVVRALSIPAARSQSKLHTWSAATAPSRLPVKRSAHS